MLKLGVRVRTSDCLPHAKFCKKNSSRGYTYLGKIYTKNLKFLRLWATSADISYLLGYVEIGTNLWNTRNSSTTQNFVTIAQGILHGACRYCIASRRWCILISSFFLVTLWNYEVCDNGNAMKQCNFQNNYGIIAQRKVFSCAPIGPIQVFLWTPWIFSY